jgi:hypothetical protein
MTPEELFEGSRKVAKDFYSPYKTLTRIARIMMTLKRFSAIIPIATNQGFIRYYKRDFNI